LLIYKEPSTFFGDFEDVLLFGITIF